MRFVWITVLLLVGCAQQPQQPTQQQLAVLAYYADQCQKQGVDVNNADILRGCIWTLYQRDMQAGTGGSQLGNVLQGMGGALTQGSQRPPQTKCETRRTPGGWETICQ